MGAFIPGEPIQDALADKLIGFLANKTLCPKEYIEGIQKTGKLPGYLETNADGWGNQPWYQAWLERMPPKKREDPFQGAVERRRVCDDPRSIRESMHPHPMIPSDAETIAGALALVKGSVNPAEIDLVLAHSQVPDRPLPANVSLIQHKLQLPNAGAYGIDTCCSSFVTMIELAESLVRAGVKNKVLIVSSYIDTHIMDKSDYWSVYTGDAALAGIVSVVDDGYGYQASCSTSHGSRHDGIIFQRRSPGLHRQIGNGPSYAQEFCTFYNPEACKEIAVNAGDDMRHVALNALEKANKSIEDVDLLVTHQPVAWAPNAWREAIGVAPEKFYHTYEKFGNVASCASGLNLHEALRHGRAKPGDHALITSSGAGENHISVLERLTPQLIETIAQ